MLTLMMLQMQVLCAQCRQPLKGEAQVRSDGRRVCGDCVRRGGGVLPNISAISSLREDREGVVELSKQLREQLLPGQGPAPGDVLELLQQQPPQPWQQPIAAIQAMVRTNLADEIHRRVLQQQTAAGRSDAEAARAADAARTAAAGLAEDVSLQFVAAATTTRTVPKTFARCSRGHDVLASAGEGNSIPEVCSKVQHFDRNAPVEQQEQRQTCLVYVKERRGLLLTHAVQLKTLRNQDDSCGNGAHSGEVAYFEASGKDPVDKHGVLHPTIFRSAIGDLVICAWALVMGIVTLIINPSAPLVSAGPCRPRQLRLQFKFVVMDGCEPPVWCAEVDAWPMLQVPCRRLYCLAIMPDMLMHPCVSGVEALCSYEWSCAACCALQAFCNYLLRGYTARSSWLCNPGLHARYHGYPAIMKRLVSRTILLQQELLSFSSYSRAADECQQQCWISGTSQVGTLLYSDWRRRDERDDIDYLLHGNGTLAAAENAVNALVRYSTVPDQIMRAQQPWEQCTSVIAHAAESQDCNSIAPGLLLSAAVLSLLLPSVLVTFLSGGLSLLLHLLRCSGPTWLAMAPSCTSSSSTTQLQPPPGYGQQLLQQQPLWGNKRGSNP
jgi:hypothetical protein